MSKQLVSGKHRLRNTYWSLVGAASAMILCIPSPVMAENDLGSLFHDHAGYLRTAGRDQYHCRRDRGSHCVVGADGQPEPACGEEATSWLKRVVVTWIILNTLGFIVAYLQPLIAGGQYTG